MKERARERERERERERDSENRESLSVSLLGEPESEQMEIRESVLLTGEQPCS